MTRMARGSSGDGYESITLTIRRKTQKAIIIANPMDESDLSIGRSLLSLISDEEVESQFEFPCTLDLEIRKWVLKKEGLI